MRTLHWLGHRVDLQWGGPFVQKDDWSHLPVGSKLGLHEPCGDEPGLWGLANLSRVLALPLHQPETATAMLCNKAAQSPGSQWEALMLTLMDLQVSCGPGCQGSAGWLCSGCRRGSGLHSVCIPGLRLTWGPQLQAMAEVGGVSPVGSVHLESFLLWHLPVSRCPLTRWIGISQHVLNNATISPLSSWVALGTSPTVCGPHFTHL